MLALNPREGRLIQSPKSKFEVLHVKGVVTPNGCNGMHASKQDWESRGVKNNCQAFHSPVNKRLRPFDWKRLPHFVKCFGNLKFWLKRQSR